jgi:BirA family biotin operon repressor/biotin-[acetyl-CoA-carboxylase] ligase
MRPDGSAADAALRSFVAALALWDAFVAMGVPGEALSLKWPNDVLLNSGKVAGILLESHGNGGGVHHLAIGIGVNLAAAPGADEVEPGAVRPVSLHEETGTAVAPEAFLDALAPAFALWDQQLARFGFDPIRDAWLSRAARLGDPVLARTGATTHAGIFETIDPTGAIVLRTPEGRIALPAADVHF